MAHIAPSMPVPLAFIMPLVTLAYFFAIDRADRVANLATLKAFGIQYARHGGIRFIRLGRFRLSFCVAKPNR